MQAVISEAACPGCRTVVPTSTQLTPHPTLHLCFTSAMPIAQFEMKPRSVGLIQDYRSADDPAFPRGN